MALVRRAIVVALLLLTLQPASARAGTYDVYSCTLPNGKPAGTQGWHAELTGKAGFSISNSCLSRPSASPTGALRGEILQASAPAEDVAWIFTAPKYTTISNLTLYRTGHTAGATAPGLTTSGSATACEVRWTAITTPSSARALPGVPTRGVGRQRPFDPANQLSVSGLQVQQLVAQVGCDSWARGARRPLTTGGSRSTRLASALSDFYPPAFTPSARRLPAVDRRPRSQGERTMSFSSADTGGGIEKVGIAFDGVVSSAAAGFRSSVRRPVGDRSSPSCPVRMR